MAANKIIDINEYIAKKSTDKAKNNSLYKKIRTDYVEEEERQKTLNLFMRVLATMEKESYKQMTEK
ncbi:hypothetical protein [Natronincola ferrireducens]|uniref:hypothetical protein n=1 Tax=Natronincola ferrireducens TaxID=393762 RepID=UPI00115FE928|nr:hypothetical protein [Natronincola ferrireducens]